MAERPVIRSARTAPSRGVAARRRELRKALERREGNFLRDLAHNPQAAVALAIALCFAVVCGMLGAWARDQQRIAVGRTATESHLVRVEFTRENTTATESRRESARLLSPRVYVGDQAIFQELESSFARLPRSLAQAESLDNVALEIRSLFRLDEASLRAIRAQATADDSVSERWASSVRAFIRDLERTPILRAEEYQVLDIAPSDRMELRLPGTPNPTVPKDRALSVANEERLREELRRLARRAGFDDAEARPLVDRIAPPRAARPTFSFDEVATQIERERAANAVKPELLVYKRGDVLIRRGEVVEPSRAELLEAERDAYRAALRAEHPLSGSIKAGATMLLFGVATLGASLYLVVFYPAIERRPRRLLLVALLALVTFAAAVWTAGVSPGAVYLIATLPTLFFASVLVIVYDQRCALLLGGLHGALLAATLHLPLVFAISLLVVIAAMIAQLAEIRQRTTLIRAGLISAGVAFVIVLATGVFDRPVFDPTRDAEGLLTPARRELLVDASLFAVSAMLVSFLTLGLLPAIERLFDVLTGMRLIELRDPKQPLLRKLAQRAPGTYTHSITVAALAESAADAVGADSLHVYVGALYHDIGKMNKPDYFVENQGGGFNRHSRLSPAMSLLVIVGHVKDGVEMAIEEGLPRSLRHYIESHHGTTLVEYFYHRAKEQAEENKEGAPAEIGYRYPGPKPQTKEAAILMLCDAVESATRALAEPTPSRIESVVRTISLKRLMDGQFDQCDLTLRELQVMEDAVIKSLNSIYHGRIAYPSSSGGEKPERTRAPKTGAATAATPAPAPAPAQNGAPTEQPQAAKPTGT